MNITKCRRAPGEACKKCEIVVQPVSDYKQTAIEYKEQDAIKQSDLELRWLFVVMLMTSRGSCFPVIIFRMHQETMNMIFHPSPQHPPACKQEEVEYPCILY